MNVDLSIPLLIFPLYPGFRLVLIPIVFQFPVCMFPVFVPVFKYIPLIPFLPDVAGYVIFLDHDNSGRAHHYRKR